MNNHITPTVTRYNSEWLRQALFKKTVEPFVNDGQNRSHFLNRQIRTLLHGKTHMQNLLRLVFKLGFSRW